MSGYDRHTMCTSVIPFIPSLNDQNQLSILKWKYFFLNLDLLLINGWGCRTDANMLGRRPIEINIKSRMIGFWLSLVKGKET